MVEIGDNGVRSRPYRANQAFQPSHPLHKFDLDQLEYHPAFYRTYNRRAIQFQISIRLRTNARAFLKVDIAYWLRSYPCQANRPFRPAVALIKLTGACRDIIGLFVGFGISVPLGCGFQIEAARKRTGFTKTPPIASARARAKPVTIAGPILINYIWVRRYVIRLLS